MSHIWTREQKLSYQGCPLNISKLVELNLINFVTGKMIINMILKYDVISVANLTI